MIGSSPRLPGKELKGAASGSAILDAAKEGVHLKLAGKFAESKIKVDLTAAGFAAPVYTFAAEVDQLDLDRYASDGTIARKPSGPARAAASGAEAGLLSPLAAWPASGTLRIGLLKSANFKARNVSFVLK